MGFFPTQGQGGLGIPDSPWSFLDDAIQPDWKKSPEILRANPAAIGVQAIRLLVVAAAALGVMETYAQVVGDASPSVDDLVDDIQDWLRSERSLRGLARNQAPRPGQKGAALPIRDGEAHEREVLRALDELENPEIPDEPGQNYEVPYPPGKRRKGSTFRGWLERKYGRRSIARYMRGRNYYG